MDYQIKVSQGLLMLLCSVPNIFCLCPLKCFCIMKNRNVDCSGKNLTAMPHGLQDNITHLNLSYNQLSNLDHYLTHFTNLRALDLSNNMLKTLPSHLPRSLWELYASNNSIKVLHKLDTAYQWNLRVLDVSRNRLQRTVFINNTMISLQLLNLSYNRLWTIPTNMPSNLLTIDLSHNFLIQILPGTLVRLPKLLHLYLHNNKFTNIPNYAFDHLTHLKEITLYNNPWACKDRQSTHYILEWVEKNHHVTVSLCGSERYEATTKPLAHNYEAQEEVTIGSIPLNTTSNSHFLEVQEPKLYKKIQYPEILTQTPVNRSGIPYTSTENSLLIDESSGDVTDIDIHIHSNEIEETESYDTTIIVSNDKVIYNSQDWNIPSTAANMPDTTVKLNDRVSSSAFQKDKCLSIMFVLLCLAIRTL
ncbi:oligodendrocyte-myelin glycoprotein [Gastrophryne carolinensis]